MEFFDLLNGFPALARIIGMIPGIIVPMIIVLAAGLSLLVFVDGVVDARRRCDAVHRPVGTAA